MENKNISNPSKINILYILRVFLSYWPTLLISCVLFLGAAMLYLKLSSKTYSVYAKILINTERVAGVRGADRYVNVNEMMNEDKTFTNEVAYLRSTPLIREVINDMNLFTSYYIQEDIMPKELPFSLHNMYKASPFIVVVDEDSPQPLNTLFYIQIIDGSKFYIRAYEENAYSYFAKDDTYSNYEYYFDLSGAYRFGDNIKNEFCSFKILLNSNYNPDYYIGKDLFFKFNSPGVLAYQFQENLSISPAAFNSSIANLTFEWENLEIATEFLTRLVDKYIEKNLEKKNLNANNTIEYIESQLENISGSLNQSESQLQNFRSSQNAININEKTSSLYGQIQVVEQTRNNLQTQLQNLSNLKTTFENSLNSSSFIAPSFTGITDNTLTSLFQELTLLNTEKQNLINTNQTRNPRIKTLDANMASITKVIIDNIGFSISATQNELNEQNKRLAQLNAEYSLLPQTQRQLLELERNFNINDEVYSSLLNQRIQAKILKASNRSDCEIIEPTRYVDVTSPSGPKTYAIALFLALFFPSVYIVIINFLTPRIRSKEELSNYCSLKSVGDIPHNDNTISNVVSAFPQSPIVEKFHAIRSNVIYYLFGETHKCILITSTLPGEGKTFTSLNLALSFASTNHKTLLIGFDLRKHNRSLDELKVNSLAGLDLYLINQATIEDIVINTQYPNLDFIHNGKIPHDPIALLSSPRLSGLFEVLKQEYDYIIIDTPPYGLVSDAFLLMKYADMILYVSRLGTVMKKPLKQCMEEISSKEIKNVYLIRNDVTKIDRSYYDRYAYYGEKKKGFLARLFTRKKKKSI